MSRDLLWVSTLTVPATSEGHALLLQLLEMGVCLYHTGQAREGNFNLYAQMRSSQWKRFARILPEWVHASEKRAQAIKDERPLLLQKLRWDFKEGEMPATPELCQCFVDRFCTLGAPTPLQVRFAVTQTGLCLANTSLAYIPILKEDRHTATQWLRRHHIPYDLTKITPVTLFRFYQEAAIDAPDHILNAYLDEATHARIKKAVRSLEAAESSTE